MKTPNAVLISDIHFTVFTLELASKSLIMAFQTAHDLRVPLVICGDTLDTKAIMRAECVNRLLRIFKEWHWKVDSYILIGNHDLLNEKGTEHSLHFLAPYTIIVDKTTYCERLQVGFIPYCATDEFSRNLDRFTPGSTIIAHTGVKGANMGHYVKDTSSIDPDLVASYRLITGHYHARQDIKNVSYVGNPYTLSFSEANDPPKGFRILYTDGSLSTIETNLRKHVIVELDAKEASCKLENIGPEDLVWVKLSGTKSVLNEINKNQIGISLLGHTNFKLDLLPIDVDKTDKFQQSNTPTYEMMDNIIDLSKEQEYHINYLKHLWKEVYNGN